MNLYHSGIHVDVEDAKYHARSEVFVAAIMKITIFQNKMLWRLAHIYFHSEDGSSGFLSTCQ
jgi:hypothetical protein